MPDFTVFWSHPYFGAGAYTAPAHDAKAAGDEAFESLSEDLADDDADELEIATIGDDLQIAVYAGSHESRPEAPADYIVR